MSIPIDVANWMLKQVKKDKVLYQQQVVYEINERFGDKFTYVNNNGNLAIVASVLKEFRKLSEDVVVWERDERCWRLRNKNDTPGRRQACY